jgi:uncharacterized protein (DUF58 family)
VEVGAEGRLMYQRFLNPEVLAGIRGLDLVAKTVVQGFIAGLHRSPDFGFSQEFAEYRAYTQGDDLRHVDWNVFARTERAYLKRYRGETNTQLMVLLDASASMGYGSAGVTKIDYARFLAASLSYLANAQRDVTGLIVFDDDVRDYVAPSSRHGQLLRLLHSIEKAEAGARTDFAKPFIHFQQFLKRHGLVAVISDFYEDPDAVLDALKPIRYRGNDLIVFHVLDPSEIDFPFDEAANFQDLETGERLPVVPETQRARYKELIADHVGRISKMCADNQIDYSMFDTATPLDYALFSYLSDRERLSRTR